MSPAPSLQDSKTMDAVTMGTANMSMSFQTSEGSSVAEQSNQATHGSPSDSGVDISIEKKTKKKRKSKGKVSLQHWPDETSLNMTTEKATNRFRGYGVPSRLLAI